MHKRNIIHIDEKQKNSTGKTPFSGKKKFKGYQKILTGELEFPPYLRSKGKNITRRDETI